LHLAHLTWGWLYPAEYVPGDPYHNVVAGFQHVWLSALYIVAMVPLSLHLYHGTWSAFQTLGLAGPLVNTWRRPFAALVATLVFLGNCSLPVAVLAGVVRPAG
jgi:succinate dehydrogenase / fumarate reductase cytochrome b subunit